MKCECEVKGKLKPEFAYMYDEIKELPFVTHEPFECKCTNNVRMYKRPDGSEKALCSNCFSFGDIPL